MKSALKFICVGLVIGIMACTNKKQEGVLITDETLLNLSKTLSSFTYLRNSMDTLAADPATNGFHGNYIRVRFNQKAISAMNDSVSGLAKIFFPDESLIVKEVYDESGGALDEIAVMYKMAGAANSGSGWIWAEYLADGSVEYSAINQGDECISCHAGSGNDDLVQTFLYH
jgi:hypothetical protein